VNISILSSLAHLVNYTPVHSADKIEAKHDLRGFQKKFSQYIQTHKVRPIQQRENTIYPVVATGAYTKPDAT